MDNSKIILDVDTGTDDAMAIITAVCGLGDRLMAITVTHGNLPLKFTLENTLRVVELMGGKVPVYAGMPDPMVQKMSPGRTENQRKQKYRQEHDGKQLAVHDDYLNLPKATIKAEKQHAVSFLVETLRETEEKITIVAVGPASNVGMALRMDPSIAKNIKQIIVMGGGHEAVNITSAAEANFFWDPEAAQIMIKADCPVVIFPLDATTSILFGKDDAKTIKSLDNPWSEFFGNLIEHWCDRLTLLGISNNMEDSTDNGIAMHDVFCILYLIDDSFIEVIKKQNCDVDFGGSFCDGRLVVDTRSYTEPEGDIKVVYKLNKKRVLELLLEILKNK
ncbi:MAG: nucleoside hydrolase [Ruminococcaceae bacterium]|nr:nucleoside hydrolase [Oscillospiraceae bacterium]